MSAPLVVRVPSKTRNPLNLPMTVSRGAMYAMAAKHRAEKDSARAHVLAALAKAGVKPAELLPCVVTLTRLSPSTLDDDGAVACCKWVRDGVAAALCIDDGSRHIRFVVRQRKCKRGEYGIEVRIEPGGQGA
jgi:hypothetical protein